MAVNLPKDVVAIDSGEKSLLFYVAVNPLGVYQLSYLESPSQVGTGEYTVKKIKVAQDNTTQGLEEDERMKEIKVSPNNTQVAAIVWKDGQGVQIRVYYVAEGSERLREVCKTGNSKWYIGALSHDDRRSNKYVVRPGTSISASVHEYGSGNFNLRVFAAEKDQENAEGLPQISVYKFLHDEDASKNSWQGVYITNTVTKY